jgi:hypothetical protein
MIAACLVCLLPGLPVDKVINRMYAVNERSISSTDTSLDAFKETLTASCRRGVPWHESAKIIHDRVAAIVPSRVAEIKAVACDVTGYSLGTVNRYVNVVSKLIRISEQESLHLADLCSPAFNSVETASKIYELDAVDGLSCLRELKQEVLSLEDVRARYGKAQRRAMIGIPPSEAPLEPTTSFGIDEQFKAALERACGPRTPWHVLAAVVREEIDKNPTHESLIKDAAATESGLMPAMVGRYVNTYGRVKHAAKRNGRRLEILLSPIFSAMEVATRLYDIDAFRPSSAEADAGGSPGKTRYGKEVRAISLEASTAETEASADGRDGVSCRIGLCSSRRRSCQISLLSHSAAVPGRFVLGRAGCGFWP